jgi:hypothetical protein
VELQIHYEYPIGADRISCVVVDLVAPPDAVRGTEVDSNLCSICSGPNSDLGGSQVEFSICVPRLVFLFLRIVFVFPCHGFCFFLNSRIHRALLAPGVESGSNLNRFQSINYGSKNSWASQMGTIGVLVWQPFLMENNDEVIVARMHR